ncbi:MAG: hypothetical protein AMQ22_01916 [Candidatus Methanofastidiosum methylothiophilum]|jgi:hypothetical protein|uniref:Uncharacterized protein n=1 Tax=Candidatus Methanofastidiosum methylothiophilum TaxID=1705564 RepID=A0A150ISN3_9EURY|nr:MAG: hypothetical protein AMQ22_01916 [Candidatus Methanofastidiosum methylthiophilus]
MADAEELKIKGLSDTYKKGDMITFFLVAENGLTSKELEDWNVSLKIDGVTKAVILFEGNEKYSEQLGIAIERVSPYKYGYGSGGEYLSGDIGTSELKISIDSSTMNKGNHTVTLCMQKKGTTEIHSISNNIVIT